MSRNTKKLLKYPHYYPFGLMMWGRSWSDGYRYGFNGKEQDAEGMGSNGSTYDYGFRIYNPAIGKFLSKDPLSVKYPYLTPYQFASNCPINGIDLDGLEYLDKDIARFSFTYGELHLNTENNGSIIQNRWNNYIHTLRNDVALCYGDPQCENYVSPTRMGTYEFRSSMIEIGELELSYVGSDSDPEMSDLQTIPKSIGPNEKLAEHFYKEPRNGKSGKVGKNSKPDTFNSGSTVYGRSAEFYAANKYIAIIEAGVWMSGPVGNFFAKKNIIKADAQARKYSAFILNDLSIALNAGIIDPDLISNSGYIADVSNWLLSGQTNFSGGIVGLSDADYSEKVLNDAKKIYNTISIRNTLKPKAKSN